MLNQSEVRTTLEQYHHPEFIQNPEGGDHHHVCQVWEDGEVTLTKGGSLWGQRNLHMIEFGSDHALPIDVMPGRNTKHGFVIVKFDERKIVRDLIIKLAGSI